MKKKCLAEMEIRKKLDETQLIRQLWLHSGKRRISMASREYVNLAAWEEVDC
jgi:hypothetical protein